MTRQRLRQIAALAGTLALLVGLPWLATFLPWPSLDFSLLSWEVHLRSGRLPAGVGTATLIIALWSVWGLYVLTLVAELLAHLRHRTVHLGPLRPLQLLAATTLGTITVTPVAYAAPTAVAVADAPGEAEGEEHQPGEGEQDSTEPMVVDRSRVIDDFDYDSVDLTEAMAQDVEATAPLIAEHGAPELPIVVTGHTDSAGDPDYNRDLSERRAQAVADALRTHLGEDAVIEVHGEGDRALLDTADDAEQRRVEINYSVVVTPPSEPSPSTTQPEETDTDDDSEATQQPGLGLSLPGGLILVMTTAGLGVLGGMALERRQDLLPHRRHNPEEEETENTAEHAPPSDSSTSARTPDTTDEPHTELALVDLARAPGLGITGPGAHGGARTLLSRAMQAREDEVTVVVPEEDLRVLLDDPRRLPVLGEDAAVMVTETVEDALTLLHLQVLARHRAADEAADEEAPPVDDEPVGPQFVLLTRAEPEVADEVTSLLAHTGQAPLSAVLLGPWPDSEGATCTIDAHGTITATEEPFTDVIDHRWAQTSVAQLLETLTHHPGTPEPAREENDDIEDDEPDMPEAVLTPSSSTNSTVSEASHAGAVSVSVLGPITLAVHGHQVRPNRRAAYEVLAYLAAHQSGARLETTVDAMWPHDAPHRGIRRFHDACTAVRSACRPHLGEDATAVISHDEDRYQLNPHLVTCDLWRIDQLLEEATHTDDSTPVTAAAAMFDQGFATTSDYLWAESVRIRVRDPLVSALIEHAESENPARAISMLKRALRIDPTSSEAAQALSTRYDEKGDNRSSERVRSEYKEALERVDAAL